MRNTAPIPIENILQSPLPPISWVLKPWIIQRSKTVLFGEFGSMKSWLLLHMALCIASGQPWCGHPTNAQTVLYIDEEMGERTLRSRLKRLAKGLEIAVPKCDLQVMSHVGVRFDGSGAGTLMDYLNQHSFRPSVIIVETLRRVIVGKENEASDVSQFWRNVDPLTLQGVTVIVAHHMRKPRTDAPDPARYRASGSTDILAGCNVGLALTRPEERTLILACVKNQDVEEAKPLTLKTRCAPEPGPFWIESAPAYVDDWSRMMQALCQKHPDLSHHAIYALYPTEISVSHATYFRRMLRVPCVHGQEPVTAATPATQSPD